jgi:hypothetical protein
LELGRYKPQPNEKKMYEVLWSRDPVKAGDGKEVHLLQLPD